MGENPRQPWCDITIRIGGEAGQGMLPAPELERLPDYGYGRYEIAASGVSPRILPGTPTQVLYADSDEQTEEGRITESAEVRTRPVAKRLRKPAGSAKTLGIEPMACDRLWKEFA